MIPKPGKKDKRPLGIPCKIDQSYQVLCLLALDPVAEALADQCSYGFRKHRGCHDAIERLFTKLCKKQAMEYIVDADIKGCFNEIGHHWILEHMNKHFVAPNIIKILLKSGYVFKGKLFPTSSGAPQGGCLSPCTANMALDGMAQYLHERAKQERITKKSKLSLTRYADDVRRCAVQENAS